MSVDLDRLREELDMCGLVRAIDAAPNHWVVVCIQQEDHRGPHAGLVSWEGELTVEERKGIA